MKFPTSMVLVALLAAVTGCGKQMSTPVARSANDQPSTQAQTAQAAPFSGKNDSADASKTTSKSLVPQEVVIPSGTAITVRLQNAVSSATSSPGDQFEAVLDQPIVVDGETIAPTGAQVTGRVVAARRSGRLTHPGYLRIALASMDVKGKTILLQSSSVMVAGAAHKKRNLAWIGGGAGGGGRGMRIAHNDISFAGALIGSAIGAAGGTGAAYATGKKDVGFGPERRLTFRLTRPITIA